MATKPKPSAPEVTPPKMVVLSNKTFQLLTCSVFNEEGKSVGLPIQGKSDSPPVEEGRLTAYTKSLAAQGHIVIRSV